jgi:hypothetical protein
MRCTSASTAPAAAARCCMMAALSPQQMLASAQVAYCSTAGSWLLLMRRTSASTVSVPGGSPLPGALPRRGWHRAPPFCCLGASVTVTAGWSPLVQAATIAALLPTTAEVGVANSGRGGGRSLHCSYPPTSCAPRAVRICPRGAAPVGQAARSHWRSSARFLQDHTRGPCLRTERGAHPVPPPHDPHDSCAALARCRSSLRRHLDCPCPLRC